MTLGDGEMWTSTEGMDIRKHITNSYIFDIERGLAGGRLVGPFPARHFRAPNQRCQVWLVAVGWLVVVMVKNE